MLSGFIGLLVFLLIIGIILWLVKSSGKADGFILNIAYAVVLIIVVLWILAILQGGPPLRL